MTSHGRVAACCELTSEEGVRPNEPECQAGIKLMHWACWFNDPYMRWESSVRIKVGSVFKGRTFLFILIPFSRATELRLDIGLLRMTIVIRLS